MQADKTGPGRLAVNLTWTVETDDGRALAQGVVPLPPSGIPPGTSQTFRKEHLQGLPTANAVASALPPGGQAWLRLSAGLARAEAWAPAGHEVAAEQLLLASLLPKDAGASAALAAALALQAAKGDGVEFRETPQALELSAPSLGLVVSLDKSFGEPQGGTAPAAGPMRITLGGKKAREYTHGNSTGVITI